jgi:hypothetical protein
MCVVKDSNEPNIPVNPASNFSKALYIWLSKLSDATCKASFQEDIKAS